MAAYAPLLTYRTAPYVLPAPVARPSPSSSARFGRLLHWAALALTAVFIVLAFITFAEHTVVRATSSPRPTNDPFAVLLVALAALIAVVGRRFRYLFAGE